MRGTSLQSPATLVFVFSRSRTGYRKTDAVLNRLIRGAIQTGLFASTFSLGNLVTFVLFPSTTLYGMFAIPIGRIYTNVSVLCATEGAVHNSDLSFFLFWKTLLDTLITRELLKVETGVAGNVTRSVVVSCVAIVTL